MMTTRWGVFMEETQVVLDILPCLIESVAVFDLRLSETPANVTS